jgi:hypothetical protein
MEMDDGAFLTEREREILSEPYRHRVADRRHNWNVNTVELRPLWDCFMLLDAVWSREIQAMYGDICDENEVFPYFLVGAAHTKVHVIIDLCFSDYIMEALSILRGAIENVVHACRLLTRPELIQVWMNRDKDALSQRSWEQEFWFRKESRLFDGMPELFLAWKMCSDVSHANCRSLLQRYHAAEGNEGVCALNYTDGSADNFPLMVAGILQVLTNLERRAFDSMSSHLQFDAELLEMRDKLENDKWAALEKLKLISLLPDGSYAVWPETATHDADQSSAEAAKPLA